MMNSQNQISGILLVNKEPNSTSFQIVSQLRKLTKIEKIGHAGTLDPFATGVMVMLIGKKYTQKSDQFLLCDKQYRATLSLGASTDTFDLEGNITSRSSHIPTLKDVELAISAFQGKIFQTPPMFSAKKVGGKKLYDLARKGITIERQPVAVELKISLLRYTYPELEILVDCSKGTYIRTLAHDIGQLLQTGAHLISLTRTRSGHFLLSDCIPQSAIKLSQIDITPHLRFQ